MEGKEIVYTIILYAILSTIDRQKRNIKINLLISSSFSTRLVCTRSNI